MQSDLKRCAACKEEKPRSDFPIKRSRPDGLYNYCRRCHSAKARERYEHDRERLCARQRAYTKRPEVVAHRRMVNKAHYAATRATQLASAKQWVRENRPRRRAYVRQWNAANRERVRAYQKTYKANKRASGRASVPAETWRLIQGVFRNRCAYCGKAVRLEQDHVQPLSRGGLHVAHNIVPACRHCNATKLNNEPLPFWWASA